MVVCSVKLEVVSLVNLGVKVGWLGVDLDLGVDHRHNGNGDTGMRHGRATDTAVELASNSKVVLISNVMACAFWGHVGHHELILNTDSLLDTLLLLLSRCIVLDGPQVNFHVSLFSLLCSSWDTWG